MVPYGNEETPDEGEDNRFPLQALSGGRNAA